VTHENGVADDYDAGSRVEAAEAGLHAEAEEAAAGAEPGQHVTATDVVGLHPHLHHPEDPNLGVVRMKLEPHTALAGVIAALVTLAGLIGVAVAVRGH
jgi:hypothetical protein